MDGWNLPGSRVLPAWKDRGCSAHLYCADSFRGGQRSCPLLRFGPGLGVVALAALEHDRGMNSFPDYRPLHRRALDDASAAVARVEPTDLVRPTPCAGWNLGALLGHAIGQNDGFAAAVENGDAPVEAFAHRRFAPDELQSAWDTSALRLTTAFTDAPVDRRIRLVEFSGDNPFPLLVVVGFQLLDTVVHTWDIATALGAGFRPDDELVAATLEQARKVPQTPVVRERQGAPFAPVIPSAGTDDWNLALALLGRR